MNYAILDIGSNTVKMTVFSEAGDILHKKSTAAGLISYVKNGIMSPEGINLLASIIRRYDEKAKEMDAGRLYPFATASLRAANNASEVVAEVEKQTGYTIDLVSGEEEARLSYRGVTASLSEPSDDMILLDIGGGSCEVIMQQGSFARSLPIGALATYVGFVKNILPTKDELTAIYEYAKALAKESAFPASNGKVCAVGGSLRAFCLFHAKVFGRSFSEEISYTVTRDEIVFLLKKVTEMDTETKLSLIRLLPERTHTFATALTAVLAILDLLQKDSITVVSGGAREGYFMKIKERNQPKD